MDTETPGTVEVAPQKRPRKKKKIDAEMVRRLAACQLSFAQMAGVLGVSESTFKRRHKTTRAIRDAVELGREAGRGSILQMLFRVALEGRNVGALIFLAVNFCGLTKVPPMEPENKQEVPDIRARMIEKLTQIARDRGDQAPAPNPVN